ncbi:hypothetical protein [Paenisporosarcina antarctica]|uniref:DUF340 domain-containing protein n=1 Tax=Paenisporosarcina antarctica TaxID=417367 RepID=A0A4P6ZZA9_9BACL|nr:hypothetical protein [Paenisporosarcina antarctica]QBP41802.1 hypothetical protein E2636_11870 [Paenisporosarcina antarctica]
MLKHLTEWTLVLGIFGIAAALGNWLGYDVLPWVAIPGLIILIMISVAGLILEKLIPGNIPAVGYIGVIGILVSLPFVPGSDFIVEWTSKVSILALATPILAYAGISIGSNWADFRKLGIRSIIVAIMVLFGTFIGSALIAEVILRWQGII